jgi:FSR family fosmidomycin resistance protein-like MFS transporter
MNSVSSTAAVPALAAPAVRTTAYALALLSAGHFAIDLYAAALAALQPRLVDNLHLSLTQAGILGGLLITSSSVAQPLYGYLSDRFHTRMFTVLAPAVAGIFLSALSIAPSFGWLLVLVVLGGAGVASFHPQASARVTQGVAASRGTWMALFISAGTLGMAFGPTFFSWIPAWLGLERTYWAAVPGVLCTILLWAALPEAPALESRGKRFDITPLKAVWKPLTILYFCVFIRSIVQVSYAQFIPLYLHRERGLSVSHANYILSAYLAFGAIGGFAGGRLADRIGGRRVIMVSMVGAVPFLLLFFQGSGMLSYLGLMLGGLTLLFTIPVNVVMAQELAPGQTGTVSALMMGFAWGMSGLVFIPLTGWASDYFSLHTVLAALAVVPLFGFELARRLR